MIMTVTDIHQSDDKNYLEGCIEIDSIQYPFDYNLETGGVELHNYSEPGWFTGASYEKKLHTCVTQAMPKAINLICDAAERLITA